MTKILIIDDSETALLQLESALKRASLTVLTAQGSQAGIEQIQKNPDVDLMIVDYNMPDLNGLEMLAAMHDKNLAKTTPVFMLTTETSPALKAQAKTLKVMAWIAKPFSEERLIEGIKKVLHLA